MTISKCEASIMIFIDFPCEHCDFGIPDGEIFSDVYSPAKLWKFWIHKHL